MERPTQEYWELDRHSLWHPYTKHSALAGNPFPIIERGEGIYLYDTEGRRYLDAISSWWACNLGHSHPRLVAAIQTQAGRLQHSILGSLSHPAAIELAARLVDLVPSPRRVLFASDGASAVEAALRVAVQYWHNTGRRERCRFAALTNGYHGDTIGAMSVGYLPSFHQAYGPLLFPVHQAQAPFCAACEYGRTPDTCAVECFEPMERIITENGAELAAVIVEPLCQGAAGMRVYAPAYLRCLAERCREAGVLLIVDEIAMGFGRTGRMFAFEHAGIDPDIVCIGKALSGGTLPISTAIVRDELFATFADAPRDCTLYHGHTFAGNPIAAAAGLECLRVYEDEQIVARAARLGEVLAREFDAFRPIPSVQNVRTLGLMAAFDLADVPGRSTGAERSQQVRRDLLDRGILLRPLGNVLYLMPPLVIDEADLVWLVEQLRDATLAAG